MISVLYVDDEPGLLEIGKVFLEQSGSILVDTFRSAAEAQSALASSQYDAVVSDYQMPGMDGIELLKVIRHTYTDLPFILFTGKGREEVVIEALNFGADFYLQKGGQPVPQFAELEHKIKQAVQQKRAERRVAESEERYRTLFENANDAIFLMDRDVFVDCNKKALDLFRCSREHLVGTKPTDHSPELQPDGFASREKLQVLIEKALKGESGVFEWRHLRHDGTGFDVESSLTHLDILGRNLILAMLRDVSERRQMECALRESAQLMTDIISFLPDATFAINGEGRVIAWNHAMERMTGVLADDIIGKGEYEYSLPFYGERRPLLIDLIFSHDSEIAKTYDSIDKNGLKYISERFIPGLNGGSGAYLWFIASPLLDSRGNVVGAIESIRDISLHKERETELRASYEQVAAMEEELRNNFEELAAREQALAQSELRFRSLFTTMVEGSAMSEIVFDDTGVPAEYRIIEVNPAFEKIFGISRNDAVGKLSRETFGTDEPGALAIYARVAGSGTAETFEIWYPPMRKHFAIAVYSPGPGTFATVFEDITPRVKKEEELRASYEQIAAVEEELRNSFEELAVREQALAASEAKFRLLFQSMNEGNALHQMIYDENGNAFDYRIIDINPSFAEILGMDRDTVIGKTSKEVYSVDEPPFMASYSRVAGTGIPERFEVYFSPMNRHFAISVYSPGKGLFATIFEDITDRVKRNEELRAAYEQIAAIEEELRNNFEELAVREQALRASEERYRRIVETANEGIWAMDAGLRTTFVNPRLAEMFGCQPVEMIGHSIDEYVAEHELTANEEQINQRRAGASGRYERCFRSRNGDEVWCIVSATPLFGPDGAFAGSFAMLTDITRRKTVEQDLKKRYSELNTSHEEMSVALEELRSTEETLLSRNRELEDQKIALAESGESLRTANRKLNLLSSVTRHDVLNQLMILNGFVEMSRRNSTDAKIQNLIEKEHLVIERIHRQISFTREYEEIGVHAPVWQDVTSTVAHAIAGLDYPEITIDKSVDGLEIYADPLLQKVFYNLLDNTIRHGEKVSRIDVSCSRSGDRLVLSVSDDGVGIDPGIKAYIFDKGFGKNTGFGLFLAREILQITGLFISETGKPGSGACFEIVVPAGAFRFP